MMGFMNQRALGLALALTAAAASAEEQLAVFPVYQQPAAELVPVLRPLLSASSTLTAHGDRLILRGSAADADTVARLLAQIDRPARRLLVEVRQTARDSAAQRAEMYQYSTADRDDLAQRVQTLDGHAALIRSGETQPEYRVDVWPGGGGVERRERLLESGFYVVPRTNGDEVTVEIYRYSERPRGDERMRSGEIATTLRGRLGEWLDLGGVDDARPGAEAGVQRFSTRGHEARHTQVRVLALD